MRIKFIIFLTFVTCLIYGGQKDSLKVFSPSFEAGSSYYANLENSVLNPSPLVAIDHRWVLNLGLGCKVRLNNKKSYLPDIYLGVNTSRVKVSDLPENDVNNTKDFSNRYVSGVLTLSYPFRLNIAAKEFTFSLGGFADRPFLLFPKVMSTNGDKLNWRDRETINFTSPSREIIHVSPWNKGNASFGSQVGISTSVGKVRLGVYYNQRLYFYGFNHEISRITFRVMI